MSVPPKYGTFIPKESTDLPSIREIEPPARPEEKSAGSDATSELDSWLVDIDSRMKNLVEERCEAFYLQKKFERSMERHRRKLMKKIQKARIKYW